MASLVVTIQSVARRWTTKCSTTYILQHQVGTLCSKAVTPNLNRSCLQFKLLLSACIISAVLAIHDNRDKNHDDNREDINFFIIAQHYVLSKNKDNS